MASRVGSFGQFPPEWKAMRPLMRRFAIPEPAASGDSLVIAIRFWTPQTTNGSWGGLRTSRPVVLGPSDAIASQYAADRSEVFYQWLPDICVGFVSILLGCAVLVFFLWQRRSHEYAWIGSYLLVITAWVLFDDFQTGFPIRRSFDSFLDTALLSAGEALLLQFVFAFLERRMPVWLKIYQLSLPLQVVLPIISALVPHPDVNARVDLISIIWTAPYAFILPGIVLWRYWQGHKEAGLLAIPLLLVTFHSMLSDIGDVLFELQMRENQGDLIAPIDLGPISIDAGQIGALLFDLGIGALLLYRFHRTSQEQTRAQGELEAARSMQEVMVPRLVQQAAGFAIESVYIPAQEVGGDFFQLFPREDGSLLVIIGDVSGKGMKAAMLVSMILGMLQRTVETTRSPAQVLRDLNRCLMGQTDGKFATCCCALMRADGGVIAANAGHLPPYCDGEEIDLPGGFPLGVSSEAEYDEVELDTGTAKRWLFISDGVVEARSKSGELYGFERTRVLSVRPVDQIAHTVQALRAGGRYYSLRN